MSCQLVKSNIIKKISPKYKNTSVRILSVLSITHSALAQMKHSVCLLFHNTYGSQANQYFVALDCKNVTNHI